MSLPLPDGFVEVLNGFYITYTGTCQFLLVGQGGINEDPGPCFAALGSWSLQEYLADVEPGPHTIKATSASGLEYLADTIDGDTAPENPDRPGNYLSGTFTVTDVYGPYRLGAKREALDGHGSDKPLFLQHMRYVYRWFADDTFRLNSTLEAPAGTFTDEYDFGVTPGDPPHEVDLIPFGFGAVLAGTVDADVGDTIISFSGMTSDAGALDTTGLDLDGANGEAELVGTGAGSALFRALVTLPDSDTASASVGAPYWVEADLDILKETGGASTGAECNLSNVDDLVTMPHTGTYVFFPRSWVTPTLGAVWALTVDSAWAAAQPVPWDPADLTALIRGVPPRLDPAEPASWQAVTLDLETAIPLADPEGFGSTGPTDGPVFTYGAVGTDAPAWRKWLGVGTLGKADPDFNPDLESRTKKDSGESFPWDWASYAYARFRLICPATVTDPFTCKAVVTGVLVTVTDSHVTGSQRAADFTVVETPFTATYLVPIATPLDGAGSYNKIDLHFPASASIDGVPAEVPDSLPFYLGRVDRIEFSEFPVGIGYLLTDFELRSMQVPGIADAPGGASFKVDFGAPVQRADYDAAHAAHNGAACCANLADRLYCTELFSRDGRAVRAFQILTGAVTEEILDTQYTLSEFAQQVALLEGWTATYETANATAALSDGTNTLSDYAQDLEPQLPGLHFTAGTGAALPARVMCGELHPAPGIQFALYTRQVLGHGALEALARVGSHRAPAGLSATLSTGQADTTGAHGDLEWGSVPANGAALVGLGSYTTALRAHDKERIPAILRLLRRLWPFNLQGAGMPFYLQARIKDGGVKVQRVRATSPQGGLFDFDRQVTTNDADTRPVLVRDHREHTWCFWAREGDGIYSAVSWDDGNTWSAETLMITGGIVPFAEEDPTSHALLAAGLVGGSLVGRLKFPGDLAFGTPFTFTLAGGAALTLDAEDTFSLAWSGDAQGRLLGHFHVDGEDDTACFQTFDFGKTWDRLL